jgi:hypothetical protein
MDTVFGIKDFDCSMPDLLRTKRFGRLTISDVHDSNDKAEICDTGLSGCCQLSSDF